MNLRQAFMVANAEGACAAMHFTLTNGAILTGFVLLLGANDFHLGLISAVPVLAQLFQIVGARWVEHGVARKTVSGYFAVLGRSIWLPMALLCLWDSPGALWTFIFLYGVSSTAMNISSPAWVAWMGDLIPSRIRGRYFGVRNRITGAVTIAVSLAAGYALDGFLDVGMEKEGYITMMAIAVLFGLVSFLLIRRQPEPVYTPGPRASWGELVAAPLRDPAYRRLLGFYIYWILAIGISVPFFSAHLLKSMGWSFKLVMWVSISSAVSAMVWHPFWGRTVDRYGHKPVLVVTSCVLVPLPLFYTFCPLDLVWPIMLNAVLAGGIWAGFGLAMFNLVIAAAPASARSSYSAVIYSMSGLANFLASMAGGWIAHLLRDVALPIGSLLLNNYQIMFLIGAVLRLPGLFLLRNVREPGAHKTVHMIRQAWQGIDRRLTFGRQIFVLARPQKKPPEHGAP